MNSYSANCGFIFPNFKMKIIKEEQENQGWIYNLRVTFRQKGCTEMARGVFSKHKNYIYRVRNSFVENTIVFKKEYGCIHNTRGGTQSANTTSKTYRLQCKNYKQQNMKRSKDIYLKEYPTEIFLKYTQNHSILVADALRHRTPSDDVLEKLNNFSKGHSPSSALHIYKFEFYYKKSTKENAISFYFI